MASEMRVRSGERELGFDIARWVEGTVDESSEAVAGFVQEAWEKVW
jgi:hypothetical protein